MNNIGIFNETDDPLLELNQLNGLIEFAIKCEKLEHITFNVIIVDNDIIRDINKTYRNIDSETDVISFALEDNDIKGFDHGDGRALGDIYISIDKVYSQADQYGHSVLRELAFLTIHGFLHLLGYDHMDKEKEKIMFERQEWILDEYNIKR